MKLAMIGLGRMGANMVRRLARDNHHIVAYNRSEKVAIDLAKEDQNIQAVTSLKAVIDNLSAPRVIWLMVPHEHVDKTIETIIEAGLEAGDLIIDGGNSNYKQSQRRELELEARGYRFMDSGTSGGVWGLENGYSLMVGGKKETVALVEPALKSLAPSPDTGWGHVGPAGAGHYVKMVHNGIEYGMMQAFAEGFELMEDKPGMDLDMQQISQIWQHGSVVRSWLLDLIADAMQQDVALSSLSDYVDDSGEGRWTIEASIEQAIPAPVLSLALQMRFRSRQQNTYSGKVLNAMRAGFGGHAIKPADDK
ncbi:MAG: phosphogluconate dehydrogenase (NAD(+)-dependent, decarboxylating) [Pseudomonadota bacterium]